jgi:exopolysaccharide biosynthesis polyprenyl glycosylphosphotransferase
MLAEATAPSWRPVGDLVVLYVAGGLALLGAGHGGATPATSILVLLFPPLVVGVMRMRRSVDRKMDASAIDAVTSVLGAVSLAAMVTIAFGSILGREHPVAIALRLWVLSASLLALTRVTLVFVVRHARRSLACTTPTLIIGAGIVAEHVTRRLLERPEYGLRPVGILDADPPPARVTADDAIVPLLGGPERLADAVQDTGARHIVISFSATRDHGLVEVIRNAHELGLEVSLVPRFYELVNERATLEHVGGLPLLTLSTVDPRGWQFALKHVIDRVAAGLALVVLGPLMLAIAFAVKLTSPGPVLYRQRRVGRDGRSFDILKYRTMDQASYGEFVPEPGAAPGGVEGVDRRTLVGRKLRDTSLDELPQLINVLRGEMSLVGPRPERPEYVHRFVSQVHRYEDRHRVRSGITGCAQVNGLRGQTSIADRVEWDNYYIRNWSFKLDMRILALTMLAVVRFREGQPQRATRAQAATGPRIACDSAISGPTSPLASDPAAVLASTSARNPAYSAAGGSTS